MVGISKSSSTKEKLDKLMLVKDELEKKINDYGVILTTNDNVGMNGNLIDSEGYPRNDIDVYQVRQARQQIICLQNDHKALMKEIEALLHQLHAEASDENKSSELSTKTRGINLNHSDGPNSSNESSSSVSYKIIAKVNIVSSGSPAELAGLRIDDNIIEFGSINYSNFENNLNQIGAIVKQMENQRITLKIKRDNNILNLVLIPKKWSGGRGLLGCNIILPESVER